MLLHRYLPMFASVVAGTVYAGSNESDRLNVLLIMVDDLRPELGCYGTTYAKTPCLDKFAARSVVFENAYCAVPVCGPSRASLLTGRLIWDRKAVSSAETRADAVFPAAMTLPESFKQAGYTTIALGKVFHNPNDSAGTAWSRVPQHSFFTDETPSVVKFREAREKINPKLKGSPRLFDRFQPIDPESPKKLNPKNGRGPIVESPDVPDNAYADGMLAEAAAKELAALKNSKKPFFLACGFFAPHLPFYAPRKYWDYYDRDKIPLATNDFRPEGAPKALSGSTEFTQYTFDGVSPKTEDFSRLMKHGYLASTSYVDAQIGRVLDALEQNGLANNTVVIVWGDHGWNLGEHSFWGKHTLTNTAMRLPLLVRVPGISPGRCLAKVSSVDIYPTLCEVAKVSAPEGRGQTLDGVSLAGLLKKPAASHDRPVFCNFRNGRTVIDGTYAYTEYGEGGPGMRMLYNWAVDPGENINISERSDSADITKRLQNLIKNRAKTEALPEKSI